MVEERESVMQGIRESVHAYLTTYVPFVPFGAEHWVTLGVTVACCLALPWFARRFLSIQQQSVLGAVLGFAAMSTYPIWIGLEAVAGRFDIREHLPIHMCRLADLALPVVMIWRRQRLYEVVYYWGLSALLQASLTPTVEASFPHFYYFRYWFAHCGLIVAVVYATAVYDMRPAASGIWWALAAMNLLLLVSVPFNLLLGANYFYVCRKPPVASLLDYLGPWPWYLLTVQVVATAHFAAAYLPIMIISRFSSSRSFSSGKPTVMRK